MAKFKEIVVAKKVENVKRSFKYFVKNKKVDLKKPKVSKEVLNILWKIKKEARK